MVFKISGAMVNSENVSCASGNVSFTLFSGCEMLTPVSKLLNAFMFVWLPRIKNIGTPDVFIRSIICDDAALFEGN